MKYFKFLIFFLIANQAITIKAQIKKPLLEVSSGTLLATGKSNPFWSVSNKYGIFDTHDNCFYLRTRIQSDIDTSKHFDYFYGFDGIGMVNSNSSVFPEQLYAGLKVYVFKLTAGWKNEHIGTQDSMLSLGGFLYSGNVRPLPRISFTSNDYFTVPFTFKILELKGGLSHAWFGNKEQYVKNTFLHDKYGYARFKLHRNFKLYAGIHHVAMWGGTSPDSTIGKLPSDIDAFWKVATVKSAGGDGPASEQINKLGNHIASYHFGFNFENKVCKLDFYWQTMLEDKNGRVGIDWKNSKDGLWGLSYTNKKENNIINKIVFEYFNSENQSGDPLKSGGDDYFYNGIYVSGWTNRYMVIGAPVITSPAFYNSTTIINNRVRAYHAGVFLSPGLFELVTKATFTRNYGRAWYPFPTILNQFYGCLELAYKIERIKNSKITGSFCFDNGKWLGNNYGLQIIFTKSINY